jgi:RimJ/RimL family protein N-acetyltransferase
MVLKTGIASEFPGPTWTGTLYARFDIVSIDPWGVAMADEAFTAIDTERMVLRRFRAGDAAALSAYRSDPEVARYQSWKAPYPLVAARKFIADMLASHPDIEGEWFQFAAILRGSGDLIGDVALHVLEGDPGSVEIGYSLAPVHRGRGYASEAVAAIVNYALDQRGKDEVMAWTDTRNEASIALLKRLGFVLDPASRQRTLFKGEWCDEDRYVMTADAWRQLSKISS